MFAIYLKKKGLGKRKDQEKIRGTVNILVAAYDVDQSYRQDDICRSAQLPGQYIIYHPVVALITTHCLHSPCNSAGLQTS